MIVLALACALVAVIVTGGTIVTLAALGYVERLEGTDESDRCPALSIWHGSSGPNKGMQYPHRCTLSAEHRGPHHIKHPNPTEGGDPDYWWTEKSDPKHSSQGGPTTGEIVESALSQLGHPGDSDNRGT